MRTGVLLAVAVLASGLTVGQALANPCPPGNPPTNCAPPTGAILDLDGTAITHSYTQYSVNFTATATTTNLSFAFREDPAFLFLDDIAVTNVTHSTAVTVVNPGFEDGILGNNAPVGWTYLNTFGASFAGVVSNNNPHSGSNNYFDGAVQAYDGITQALSTTVGDLYEVTFWLSDDSNYSTYSRVSTNGDVDDTGGNGVDLLVYAGAIPTINPLTPVPEPATLALLGLGLVGLGFSRRKKA